MKIKFALFFLALPCFIFSQSPKSAPLNYVTDETGILNQAQQNSLNNKLKSFEDSTSNQIFVYLSNSLNGEEISDFSQKLFVEWKIGSKDKNNGVLITVFVNDHKFRIHTGYGLEGALPDQLTKRIQDETMRVHFKQNDYFLGLDKGIDELIYYSKNEFQNTEIAAEGNSNYWVGWLIGYIPNLILLIILIYNLKKHYTNQKTKKSVFLIFGIILALIPCIGSIILFVMVFITSKLKLSGRGSGSDSTYISSSNGYSDNSSSSDSSSDSSSSFDGGGGGDSGGGGSSSDW